MIKVRNYALVFLFMSAFIGWSYFYFDHHSKVTDSVFTIGEVRQAAPVKMTNWNVIGPFPDPDTSAAYAGFLAKDNLRAWGFLENTISYDQLKNLSKLNKTEAKDGFIDAYFLNKTGCFQSDRYIDFKKIINSVYHQIESILRVF